MPDKLRVFTARQDASSSAGQGKAGCFLFGSQSQTARFRACIELRVTMWFQLALYPDAPLLGIMVGSDNLLYFRTIDLGHLLGKKYGFGKQFPYDIVFGKDVLPRTQTYPRYTANARLVTQDIAYRILCREHRELAERLSNAFDSGYAYVQGKRTFELTYKNSPRLLVVNTPHENTVKVSHWIRDFMLDVERQRATELFRLVASESPGYNETMEATREIARENIESTQEMNRECTQEMHETMEVGENPMVDGENGIAARPDPMGDEENGIAAGQNQMMKKMA
ncbi:hypothetical protein TNCV_3943131 [Trichonephila clavipes]|nr:hypothetical protein TNCV_3943131 [Trichonephila clavipes]